MTDIVQDLKEWADNVGDHDCSAAFDRAVAEIERLRALTEWRPIETAPKNTPVLVYGKWDGEIGNWRGFPPEHGVASYEFNRWDAVISGGYSVTCEPTNWLPLPPPPEDKP